MGFSSPQLGHEEGPPPPPPPVSIEAPTKPNNSEPPRQIAVQVKNACKAYGKGPPILNHLYMTVPRGTIYSLLGSSGCGKTTMLSCIVGLRKLDEGEIWVYGAKPGTKESGIPGKTIGYMPQDIALYQKFSVGEILHYFGGIYGMTKSEISARMEFLAGFLDLPEPDRRVGSLSGGQQRRVSLSVAMIHTPALLILDEPTVGVDPLIRESIWEYLIELVSRRRTTVIVTTHYIEESRPSHTVGLMRNGKLLVEKPPLDLLQEHGSDLLEDIVLKICRKDDLENNKDDDEVTETLEEMSFYTKKKRPSQISLGSGVVGLKFNAKPSEPEDDALAYQRIKNASIRRRQSVIETVNTSFSRQTDKVVSLIMRNFLTLFRNPVFVFGLLIIPTFQTILFNFIVRNEPIGKHMGVVNMDLTNGSYPEFCEQRETGCMNDGISCVYLNQFGNKIVLDPFDTVDEALDAVRIGKSKGLLLIPENYTHNMKFRALHKSFADNATLDGSTMKIYLDYSNNLHTVFIIRQIFDNYLGFMKEVVTDCGGDPAAIDIPLKYNAVYGSVSAGMLEFLQPPQVLITVFLLPMTVAISYIWDKKAGTLDRTMVAGVDYFHVVISLLVSEGIMIILEIVLCLATMIFIFNFQIEGSTLLVFILAVLTGVCGLSFGFLFGVMCDHEIEVFVWILMVYLPSITASGATWPREGMHPWARIATGFLPVTIPIEAMRGIVSRGWGLTHVNVFPGFLVLIGWTGFCVIASAAINRIGR